MAITLLDHRGSVLKTLHTDASDDDRIVEVTHEDLDPLIEHVKHLRESHTDIDGMRLMALVPVHVVERMMRDGAWNDEAAMKRWMNDPQNECFRVAKGRV